jgi:ADYC domain
VRLGSVRVHTLILLGMGACSIEEPNVGSSTAALDEFNGESLNGESLNGESLNGESLNGESLNGPDTNRFTIWTSLENVHQGGTTIQNVQLAATVFTGTRNGTPIQGADFVGAHFTAMRGSGSPVSLKITSAHEQNGLWTYGVAYYERNGNWYSICHNSAGTLPAMPLEGVWNHDFGAADGGAHTADSTRFTFACTRVATLAKCVADGYLPWVPQLAPYHQACVRMLRADYCGNGVSYTTTGRLVNLYDGLGVQTDTSNFRVEAEWDASGARCVTSARRAPANADLSCVDSTFAASCGDLSHFDSGTLIINEIP